MLIVIAGCGRLGSYLARCLDREGHKVAVIDVSIDSFRRLGVDFNGRCILGFAADEETLKKAGIKKADALAAVTNGDHTNFLVAQMAITNYNIPTVVARLYDPDREDLYTRYGIKTICPTKIAADLFFEALTSDVLDGSDEQEINFNLR